ncbi:hypothetical protein NQ318_022595 [Aromia moschata]|uniref:Uncharacterized protein n=1 Tax=Aromia moschata TaxID=1265417 RepID=A0AAV8XX19_9CUCU|nr:hypothetical protein NQ318_022595 [Aromia moschata]
MPGPRKISKNDIVSQKICAKCCHITIKMFEFRKTSMKNDSYLKEECSAYLKNNNVKIPNTNITIRNEGKIVKPEQSVKRAEQKQERDNKSYKVHPSVRALFKTYPQIKLPTTCVKSNIAPVVCLEMDGVENYFRSRQLDFNYHTKLALRSDKKVATKRTSAPTKPKRPNVQSDNSEIKPVKAVIRKSESQPIKITFKFNIKNNESELKSESADSRIEQKNDLVPEKISSNKKKKTSKNR